MERLTNLAYRLLLCRGHHLPSWRTALARGVTDVPVCLTCGTRVKP